MFENLSNREKKLLLAIGALLPIVLFFIGIIYISGSIKENNQQLESIDLQIVEQETIELKGMLANRRQSYYANASLHPETNIASNEYQNWLKKTMAASGLNWSGRMSPSGGSRLRSGNEAIGEILLFKVNASGTLPEFNDFLSKFYQVDMLHRITKISLTPQTEPRTTTRNGELTVKMDFEILSLKAGKKRDDFSDFRKHLANSEKNYDQILRRNIFGPANSEPVITVSNKTTVTGRGKPYSFSITAKDADKGDLLTFELLESSIENAVLKPKTKEKDRSARFEIPDMPPGTYDFTVKVSDTGNPVKYSIKEFAVTVKPKPAPKPEKVVETKKPEPEEVDYIKLVKVTGITSDRDGKWRVWVSIGPTGERLRLSVGESFEIDKKKYEVVTVKEDEATFAGDNKTFVARPDFSTRGQFFETNL